MTDPLPILSQHDNRPPDDGGAGDHASLRISETFASIQGEGKLTGAPSFFVRTSGCNLRCTWCDTPYASWDPEGPVRTVEDIVREAVGVRERQGVRHAVLTGGEPMLPPAIVPLTGALRDEGFHITIETAGTIVRPVACDLMSLSPKLANSTPAGDPRDPSGAWADRHEQRRLKPDALRMLWHGAAELSKTWDRQCKFVVKGEADLPEIEAVLAILDEGRTASERTPPSDIMLMPEGTAVPSPETRDAVQRICMRTGYRYCTRLHIHLYGDTRGT